MRDIQIEKEGILLNKIQFIIELKIKNDYIFDYLYFFL